MKKMKFICQRILRDMNVCVFIKAPQNPDVSHLLVLVGSFHPSIHPQNNVNKYR